MQDISLARYKSMQYDSVNQGTSKKMRPNLESDDFMAEVVNLFAIAVVAVSSYDIITDKITPIEWLEMKKCLPLE